MGRAGQRQADAGAGHGRQWLAERTDRPHVPELRFDAIGITIDARGRLVALEHLEGAFSNGPKADIDSRPASALIALAPSREPVQVRRADVEADTFLENYEAPAADTPRD